MAIKKLTPKQEAFAQHYAVHDNGVAAYRHGYDCSRMIYGSIEANARKMLADTRISTRIDELRKRAMDELNRQFDIKADKILQELAAIGFANMKDFVRIDESGQPELNFTALERHQFAAVGELTIEDIETGRRTGKRTKFKLLDKKGALVELGKYAGIFSEKIKHEHSFVDEEASDFDARMAGFVERAGKKETDPTRH